MKSNNSDKTLHETAYTIGSNIHNRERIFTNLITPYLVRLNLGGLINGR